MHVNNDNCANEQDFLLLRALKIVAESPKTESHPPCPLLTGGACPLLKSMLASLKDSPIKVA